MSFTHEIDRLLTHKIISLHRITEKNAEKKARFNIMVKCEDCFTIINNEELFRLLLNLSELEPTKIVLNNYALVHGAMTRSLEKMKIKGKNMAKLPNS